MSSLPQCSLDKKPIPCESDNSDDDAEFRSVREKSTDIEIRISQSAFVSADDQDFENIPVAEKSKNVYSSHPDRTAARAARKRKQTPYTKTVVSEFEYWQQNVASTDLSYESSRRPQGIQQKVSFRKRKLPDTPQEKQDLKSIDFINPDLVGNGKKCRLVLSPEEVNRKADQSHLTHHGFSPGIGEVNQMEATISAAPPDGLLTLITLKMKTLSLNDG